MPAPQSAYSLTSMYRTGTDPNNVRTGDVLCDYCHREWSTDIPMIEGHRGSCICGRCLAIAIMEIGGNGDGGESSGQLPPGLKCTMCLEERDEPMWRSPLNEYAAVCRRCIMLASETLEKDADTDWSPPPGST